ncbi:hypothetical protein BST61_g6795 [Cercospora zeina]
MVRVDPLKSKLQPKRLRTSALRTAQEKNARPLLVPKDVAKSSHAPVLEARPAPRLRDVASLNAAREKPILSSPGTTRRRPPRPLPLVHISHLRQRVPVLAVPRQSSVKEMAADQRRQRRMLRTTGRLGSVVQLQRMLGVGASAFPSLTAGEDRNVTFVALDLEWARRGLEDRITEIGVSWLRAEDIRDTDPGPWMRNWVAKMQHAHIITSASSKRLRCSRALFSESRSMHVSLAKTSLIEMLKSFLPSATGRPNSRIVLVGQSIGSDIAILKRDTNIRFDLMSSIGNTHQIFDTYHLAALARKQGVKYESMKLSSIAMRWGIENKYWTTWHLGSLESEGEKLRGVHSAGNDAAYSLLTVLLFGLRWDDMVATPEERRDTDVVWRETGRRIGGEWGIGQKEAKSVVGKYIREKGEDAARLIGDVVTVKKRRKLMHNKKGRMTTFKMKKKEEKEEPRGGWLWTAISRFLFGRKRRR